MSEGADAEGGVRRYLEQRLRLARRRARWAGGLGVGLALVLGLAGQCASDAVGDPEGVVELLPLHTARVLQGGVVRSLQAGAPSSAVLAHRQLDRVPSEINAVVRRELEVWITDSVKRLAAATPEQLRELARRRPEEFTRASGVPELLRAELRPGYVDALAPVEVGPTAYLVATANAVEALGEDAPSAEQLLEHLLLGLLTHLIAPA